MRSDPYFIEGPALISFSGGRTSAYMLKQILDRGIQPDVHVLFCNTGKEDDRTLDFVRDCGEQWGVPIRWLEYRRKYLPKYKSTDVLAITTRVRKKFGLHFENLPQGVDELGFVEVTYATAARTSDPPTAHHPFTNMIAMSGVPNVATRMCTQELKIRVMKKFMRLRNYPEWTNIVGIRADEPSRVAKLRVKPRERWENAVPLADAGVTVEDVLAFWAKQSFDLALNNDPKLGTYEGNCDLCMLKSEAKKVRLVQERPESLDWWDAVEKAANSPFRPKAPYAMFRRLPVLVATNTEDDLGDCICHE